MSFVCHCGWSGTTYQGMRIHQGKKGCMLKGLSIPQNEYYGSLPKLVLAPPLKIKDPWIDFFNTDDSSYNLPTSIYQGLTIHQRMMGPAPKGMRIPENEQYIRRHKWEEPYREDSRLFISTPVKEENILISPNLMYQRDAKQDDSIELFNSLIERQQLLMGANLNNDHQGFTTGAQPFPMPALQEINPQNNPGADESTVKKETSFFETPQRTHQTITASEKAPDISTDLQQPFMMPALQEINTQNNPVADETTVKEIEKSLFETPQRSHQTVTTSEKVCRALDFSTDLKKENDKENDKERETQKPQKARHDRMRADLQQNIRVRDQKMAEFRSSVTACKGSLDAEWLEVNAVFSEVMRAVEDARQKALQPLEERRQKVKRAERDLVQKLQREIDTLRETIKELDKNPDWQGSHLTNLDDFTFWENAMVDTSSSFGTLRTVTSTMMKHIQEALEKLSPVELKRIPTFEVDVKLDPATAHQSLVLSDDGKKVRDGTKKPKVPDTPERFDLFGSVLGCNSLTSGKSYWEVEVSNKTGWDLGVARGNTNRKGKLTLNPENGYWVTVHFEDKKYAALTAPPVQLSLKEKPQKVGVFVDYEEGLVSFYNVTTQSHIYSFTECLFGGEIFPYFSPHLKQDEKNADPLIISRVQKKK
ncbi:E3 ubiquitin-protein ligase TRIM35-like [Mugil cephalus]|uniref:E3 ubiquitin-protein ligase TRIM35-like n=1 Tax=Mugil cephalus TaxID=48193 RepID=UPI001FB5BCAA|nr:E3 ubiquitin-protein ligase TRIM35-like [Mugil cephalus]